MSDDIFTVATPFPDVASLAQGYMNRADGERLLLPLPGACRQGGGVRFVVCLGDGTPAFAGAGLCAQVSDQGTTVAPDQRFETLIDTLQFDERSRPVYDYIVAVRNAAYAEQQAAAGDGDVEPVVDGEAEAVPAEESYAAAEPEAVYEDEATRIVEDGYTVEAGSEPEAAEIAVEATFEDVASHAEPESTVQAVPAYEPDAMPIDPAYAVSQHPVEMPSFIPPPLPTGLLTRPARTTHWQPAPPRRPTPRPATGLFRYASGLPRPERPPYPELDRAAWVQPAPRPAQ